MQISLSYNDYSYWDILRKILPENIIVPTGFETIGKIAHFNLRPEHEPYKKLIGTYLFFNIRSNYIG